MGDSVLRDKFIEAGLTVETTAGWLQATFLPVMLAAYDEGIDLKDQEDILAWLQKKGHNKEYEYLEEVFDKEIENILTMVEDMAAGSDDQAVAQEDPSEPPDSAVEDELRRDWDYVPEELESQQDDPFSIYLTCPKCNERFGYKHKNVVTRMASLAHRVDIPCPHCSNIVTAKKKKKAKTSKSHISNAPIQYELYPQLSAISDGLDGISDDEVVRSASMDGERIPRRKR